jgi:ADP-heptose:LPS heptosyltransferase
LFSYLQVYEPRERALVGLADLALAPLGWRHAPERPTDVRRVLLLRLERIGDLLMVLDAIGAAREAWAEAEIDLAVGSWNLPLAQLIPGVTRLLTADVPWLARERAGDSWRSLARKARAWRAHDYDLVVNFEPDIRSNYLAWRIGGRHRVGYFTGGGGALLDSARAYDPTRHVSDNALDVIARASGRTGMRATAPFFPRLIVPADALARVDARLAGAQRPLVGIHAAGGRESKQWHPDRFAEVGRAVAAARGATVVLTGAPGDRPLVDRVRQGLATASVVDAAQDLDLVELAALLARLDVLVTGDTGPMHLAAAMGTPLVALFGPSNPVRYGPRSRRQHVVRIDLPCSPCGRVRLPPERCRGHVPDCLDGIGVGTIVGKVLDLIDAPAVPPGDAP